MPSILDQLLGNAPQDPNTAQQILSARFQPQANGMMPNFQPSDSDLAQTMLTNATGFNGSPTYKPVSPQQVAGENQLTQIVPYDQMMQAQGRALQNNITSQTGVQSAQSDIAYKQAMANAQNNAVQRDIAEKQYQYANDPQMAQARMMAQYMQSLSGGGTQQSAPQQMTMSQQDGSVVPQVNQSALQPSAGIQVNGSIPNPPSPMDLNQAMQQNAQPQQGGGFNPMGAMLAKSLGLTDMQIGPNGQPMPIPGSMKVENGSVISFDQNGKPQSNIPINPRAQGLFEQKLQDIYQNVNKLHDLGGTVEENPDKGLLTNIPLVGGFLENKATQMAASQGGKYLPSGQDFLQGTEAQTIRDNIQADVKQALPLYMQAFGITPGMERAQAAQQMLQDAIGGSLTKSRQHTVSNLKNLSQTAGTGQLAQQLSRVNVVSPSGQQGSIAPEELQAAMANGWKQVQ